MNFDRHHTLSFQPVPDHFPPGFQLDETIRDDGSALDLETYRDGEAPPQDLPAAAIASTSAEPEPSTSSQPLSQESTKVYCNKTAIWHVHEDK